MDWKHILAGLGRLGAATTLPKGLAAGILQRVWAEAGAVEPVAGVGAGSATGSAAGALVSAAVAGPHGDGEPSGAPDVGT